VADLTRVLNLERRSNWQGRFADAIDGELAVYGGRGGIRTHGTVTRTPDFESGAFDQLSHPSFVRLNQGPEDNVNRLVVDI
jgi:hypothetical protein